MFPVIDIISKATNSYSATCILGIFLIVLLYFSTVNTIASASRQVWAFSRDQVRLFDCSPESLLSDTLKGLPFSKWIRYVRPGWDIPVNAVSEHSAICRAIH